MTSVSMTSVTDPSSVNTESAGAGDAEGSQAASEGGEPSKRLATPSVLRRAAA